MTNTQSSDYVCKGLTEGRMFFPTPTHCFQCGGARWETPDRPVTSNEPSPLESAPPGGRRSEVSMNSVDPPAQEINAHSVQVTFAGAVCACVSLFLTHCGPSQPHNHSRWSDIIHPINCENRFTHKLLQVFRSDHHSGFFTIHNTERHLTENLWAINDEQ